MGEHRPPRYINQPFVVEITSIERLQAALDMLADAGLTPRPRRIRAMFERMSSRLEVVKRELETRAGAVAEERAAEDHRGS